MFLISELYQKMLTLAEMCFSRKTPQPGIRRIQGGIIGAIISYPVVIELFTEIVVKCEVKPVGDLKGIAKAIVKMYIQVCTFSKARDIVQKFQVSKNTQNKSLQKHLRRGIC